RPDHRDRRIKLTAAQSGAVNDISGVAPGNDLVGRDDGECAVVRGDRVVTQPVVRIIEHRDNRETAVYHVAGLRSGSRKVGRDAVVIDDAKERAGQSRQWSAVNFGLVVGGDNERGRVHVQSAGGVAGGEDTLGGVGGRQAVI